MNIYSYPRGHPRRWPRALAGTRQGSREFISQVDIKSRNKLCEAIQSNATDDVNGSQKFFF